MAARRQTTKPNLLKFVSKWVPVKGFGVISLNSESEPCSTRELVVPIANYPIILGRIIQLYRHLEHQNPSIVSDSIV